MASSRKAEKGGLYRWTGQLWGYSRRARLRGGRRGIRALTAALDSAPSGSPTLYLVLPLLAFLCQSERNLRGCRNSWTRWLASGARLSWNGSACQLCSSLSHFSAVSSAPPILRLFREVGSGAVAKVVGKEEAGMKEEETGMAREEREANPPPPSSPSSPSSASTAEADEEPSVPEPDYDEEDEEQLPPTPVAIPRPKPDIRKPRPTRAYELSKAAAAKKLLTSEAKHKANLFGSRALGSGPPNAAFQRGTQGSSSVRLQRKSYPKPGPTTPTTPTTTTSPTKGSGLKDKVPFSSASQPKTHICIFQPHICMYPQVATFQVITKPTPLSQEGCWLKSIPVLLPGGDQASLGEAAVGQIAADDPEASERVQVGVCGSGGGVGGGGERGSSHAAPKRAECDSALDSACRRLRERSPGRGS